METLYRTLQTIYKIVKQDTDPTTFPCSYRDIILNSTDTTDIQQHLDTLVSAGLLLVKKLDCTVFCITSQGIEQIQAIELSQRVYPAIPESQ